MMITKLRLFLIGQAVGLSMYLWTFAYHIAARSEQIEELNTMFSQSMVDHGPLITLLGFMIALVLVSIIISACLGFVAVMFFPVTLAGGSRGPGALL